jgi:hypothetical protein
MSDSMLSGPSPVAGEPEERLAAQRDLTLGMAYEGMVVASSHLARRPNIAVRRPGGEGV